MTFRCTQLYAGDWAGRTHVRDTEIRLELKAHWADDLCREARWQREARSGQER